MEKFMTITMDVMKNAFKDLVYKFGENDELHTFDICTNYGVELADSTIDKIEVYGDYIRFYYNENINDYGYIEEFSLDDLYEFYKELKDALNEKEEEVEDVTETDIANARSLIDYYNCLDIDRMPVADALAEVTHIANRMSEILEKFIK